ncbi:MAG: signal peptidase I [Candidatus Aminicenantes bacterium]|nr:signal peptidase I [Candidatus Aminicenantes bacterium]
MPPIKEIAARLSAPVTITLRGALNAIILLAIYVFFGTTFVVQAFRITSGSLEPTLLVGDYVLVNRMIYENAPSPIDRLLLPRRPIRRGDLVVFKDPQDLRRDLVKRIIGLADERLEIVNKDVLINDIPLAEPYVFHADPFIYTRENLVSDGLLRRDNFGPITVPAGTVFVMGDNRDDSDDSRFWGTVPVANLKGKPWLIYFSFEVARDPDRKTSATGRLRNIERPFPTIRLGRFLTIVR